MTNDFEILASFLENFEPEVVGHAAETISDTEAAAIAKMARGELSESERTALAPLLSTNERAMSLLVAELRRGA